MKTSTIVYLSGMVWTLGALQVGQPIIAAVVAVGHVLFWQLHVLEVKLNKLLEAQGVWVTKAEENN